MALEFKELLERIDATQEKIQAASRWCIEYLNTNLHKSQVIVDTWSKFLETGNQKIALLFLANDIILQNPNENLKSMFQIALPRAFMITATNPTHIQDIKKVLKVWDERHSFPRAAIEEWERICMRAENKLPIVDRSNLIYVINLARRLKQLKDISEAKENENGNGTLIVRKVREELIREILSVIKKVNHGNLNVTIQIRKISEKLLELD